MQQGVWTAKLHQYYTKRIMISIPLNSSPAIQAHINWAGLVAAIQDLYQDQLSQCKPSASSFVSPVAFPSFKSQGFSDASPTSPKFLKLSGISVLSSALLASSSSVSDSAVFVSVNCRLIRSCSERACRA